MCSRKRITVGTENPCFWSKLVKNENKNNFGGFFIDSQAHDLLFDCLLYLLFPSHSIPRLSYNAHSQRRILSRKWKIKFSSFLPGFVLLLGLQYLLCTRTSKYNFQSKVFSRFHQNVIDSVPGQILNFFIWCRDVRGNSSRTFSTSFDDNKLPKDMLNASTLS